MFHLLQSAGLIRVKEAGCWLTDARRIKAVITDKNGSSPRRRNVLQAKIKRRGWCKKLVGGCGLFNLNRLNYCCTYFLSGMTEFWPTNTLWGFFYPVFIVRNTVGWPIKAKTMTEFKCNLPEHEYFDPVSDTTSSIFTLIMPQMYFKLWKTVKIKLQLLWCEKLGQNDQ